MAAYINCQDNVGDTTLHHACRNGNVYVVQALATCPALDITLRNTAGRTAWTALDDSKAVGAPEARAKCKAIIQPLWDKVEAESAAKQRELLAELGVEGGAPAPPTTVKTGHSKRRGKRKRGKRNRGKASKEASGAAADSSSRQAEAGSGAQAALGDPGVAPAQETGVAAVTVATSSGLTGVSSVPDAAVSISGPVLSPPFTHSQPPGLGPAVVSAALSPDHTGAQVDVTRAPPGLVPQSVALSVLDTPSSRVVMPPVLPSMLAGFGGAAVPPPTVQRAVGGQPLPASVRDWAAVRSGVAGAGAGAAAGVGGRPHKGAGSSSSDDADASGSSSGTAGDGDGMLVAELTARLHARFPKAEAVELHAEHMVGEGLSELSAGQLEVCRCRMHACSGAGLLCACREGLQRWCPVASPDTRSEPRCSELTRSQALLTACCEWRTPCTGASSGVHPEPRGHSGGAHRLGNPS